MKVSLHTSALAAQAHTAVVLPWLKKVAQSAARTPRATAVLVPLQADAYHLKARALDAGLALCGVHFLTPGELRERLIRHLDLPLRVPPREHLRLLLATAAERAAVDAVLAEIGAGIDDPLEAIGRADVEGAAQPLVHRGAGAALGGGRRQRRCR